MYSGLLRNGRAAFAILAMIAMVSGASSFLIMLNASSAPPVVLEGPMQSTSGPLAPASVAENNWIPSGDWVMIDGVPSYEWYNGCGPTAVGMVLGYWDGHGFDDLVPGDASVQNSYVDAMIASAGHIEDYAYPYDNYYTGILPDKSTTLDGAHSSDCVADFMHTSWSSDGNMYGWSWSDMVDDGFSGYVSWANSAYSVATTWVIGSGLTWERYVHEIDSGHPVVFLVDSEGDGYTDHFVTAIGYSQVGSDKMYACYDTWGNYIRYCDFARMSKNQPFGIYDATFIELTKKEAYCASKTWGVGAPSVSWTESAAESYAFSVLIDNNGFKSAVVEIFDTTYGKMTKVFHETVNMRSQDAYPFGWASTASFTLIASHTYSIWVGSLDGPIGSYVFVYPAQPPFTVWGYTLDSGRDPFPDCDVTITDLRTGASLSSHSDPISAYFSVDLNSISDGWEIGDVIRVDATKDTMSGWREVMLTCDNTNSGSLQMDVVFWPVGPPPVPYMIAGCTYDADNMPLPSCSVTLTDLRTGGFLTTVTDTTYGWYQVDLNEIPGGWRVGDTIEIAATLGVMNGFSEVLLIDSDVAFTFKDVILLPVVFIDSIERVYFGVDLEVLGSNMYVLTWQYDYGPVFLYRSADRGATWSSPVNVFGYSITYADPGMCAYRDGDRDVILVASGPGYVAKSVDGGQTFSRLGNLPGYWRFMSIGTRASWFGGTSDSEIFVVGSTQYSYGNLAFTKSGDGGLTWSAPAIIDPSGACPEMTSDGANLFVAYISPLPYDGALYVSKSSDWGVTWSARQILVQERPLTWNIRPYSFQYIDGQKALLTIRDQATTGPADNYGAYGYFDFATMTFQETARVDQTTWIVHEGFAGKLMPDGRLAIAWIKWTSGISSQLMFGYI